MWESGAGVVVVPFVVSVGMVVVVGLEVSSRRGFFDWLGLEVVSTSWLSDFRFGEGAGGILAVSWGSFFRVCEFDANAVRRRAGWRGELQLSAAFDDMTNVHCSTHAIDLDAGRCSEEL